ncbi:cardiolipin synthase [Ketogulonicigenium vulgare]|uniref:Cardiolipin synthase n=1 Tax=Ketogulonicigenium vulgare (strain WSH-001) TaxID=759362 RepID=F9Y7R8_KETVW|nr:cardiolipin synthase [Ketogulonicigenium vulgare]AEM39884.1 Cardiolipin synthetase 2 [Ketogulonicigenium vulgare WSH-001]ALJ80102.1 cardiolipin synthase [Ketogulonicigenium vulgare]ANW32972.1 cardiolipin synthase [Ketogulonicigenium vulgare]AOZ53578.1 phospholipase D/transphosphatidylase [Ketogulonicigenium vulgare]
MGIDKSAAFACYPRMEWLGIPFDWRTLATFAVLGLHYALVIAVIFRVLVRDQMEPVVRLSWVMLIALIPVLGVIVYLLFGEIRLNRAKGRKMQNVRNQLTALWEANNISHGSAHEAATSFAMGTATSDFVPVTDNRLTMLPQGDAMMDDMIAAIDGATDTVHILFYIWLPDTIGTRMVQAVSNAARRGVTCRVLVDALGSRLLIGSKHWKAMRAAGVRLHRAFPFRNPLVEVLFQRVDLRNHRKVVVVDNHISWIGSRNCADEAFAIKRRYAPWIDILMRVEGPLVRQMQAVFIADWMLYDDDAPVDLLVAPQPHFPPEDDGPVVATGTTGQVIASGPSQSQIGIADTLIAMCYAARRRLTATTPYYLPDPALHQALLAAARRGVDVTLVLPKRNDSWIIAAASRSLYPTLLAAGVKILEYEGGLLHAKIMTVDGMLSIVGSANLDRRSFDLNYECNILMDSPEVADMLDERQAIYLQNCKPVTLADVARWPTWRKVYHNLVALAGPLL